MKHDSLSNSPDRTAINRANAQHSTGPRTEAGKQVSRFNALRHGLTGHVVVLPSEDQAAYQAHSRRFLDDFQPKGALESQLVQTLIDTTWRLNRIPAIETNYLTLGITQNLEKINADHPEARAALAMARALDRQSRALANLSIYEQRLSRLFERTLKQLREIQAERRANERHDMIDAAQLLKLHAAKDIPYDPKEDGFVFSAAEIETYIGRTDRLSRAYLAAASV
ncbi:MAG TPA: hypothetical protein VGR50_08040 [Terriglobales bacterium]|nr:hypothetical protein [Terriglobales bacterium]